MGTIAWIISGLIAGVIAKLIMPGRGGGEFILTCILGVAGAVAGGQLAVMFGIGGDAGGFNLHSFLMTVVDAIVVPDVFRLVRRDQSDGPYGGRSSIWLSQNWYPIPAQ